MSKFNSYTLTMSEAEALLLFHEVLENLDLTDEATKDRVFNLYIQAEFIWAEIRRETDYDDYH